MPLTSTYAEYTTDDNKTVMIKVNYEGNVAERLTTGGLTAVTGRCRIVLKRKYLKPRYIDYINDDNKVERVVFKTHALWKSYINDNKEKIVSACGECLGCTAIAFLYVS